MTRALKQRKRAKVKTLQRATALQSTLEDSVMRMRNGEVATEDALVGMPVVSQELQTKLLEIELGVMARAGKLGQLMHANFTLGVDETAQGPQWLVKQLKNKLTQ